MFEGLNTLWRVGRPGFGTKRALVPIQSARLPFPNDAAQITFTALLKRIEDEKVGIRSEFTDQRTRPLSKLIEEHEQHAAARNITDKQAAQTRRRCEKVFEGCRFVALANLDAITVKKWLAERRGRTKKDGGISVQTSNHYVTALKAFGAWLVRTKKAPNNPFQFLAKGSVEVDVRHVRRALVADEFARLLDAGGPVVPTAE